MENLFNGEKLRQYFKKNKLTTLSVAKELNIHYARISEIINGLLVNRNIELLDKICKHYNINKNELYKDFIEPEYMINVREKIKMTMNDKISFNQLVKLSGLNKIMLSNIINYQSYTCYITTAEKIIFIIDSLKESNYKNIDRIINNTNLRKNNIENILGKVAYNKLFECANKNFNGDINETLKFIVYNHFYKNKEDD